MTTRRPLRTVANALAAAALSTIALAGTMGTATATAGQPSEGRILYGCPPGAVCIYDTFQSWDTWSPDEELWSYGLHSLAERPGRVWVVNNQTGEATAQLCSDTDGHDCWTILEPGDVLRDTTTPGSVILRPT